MAIRHPYAFRQSRYPFRIPLHWDLRTTISPKKEEQITGETPVLRGATLSPRERVRRGKGRHIT